MILYFADRQMNVLGQASTNLPHGFTIVDDTKTEDIETGIAIFECKISFRNSNRLDLERWAEVGNYLLRSHENENEFYQIIDVEIDTKKQTIYVYAEDDGLDLLNEVVGTYEASQTYPISHYINKYAEGSGWTIGINEIEGLTRKLSFDSEQTTAARILKIAELFDNAEISYSFEISGLKVTKKYINIYQKRGADNGVQLRLNKEIDNIVTTKTISNLATALQCSGGTPDNAESPINLKGYSYDDGDFYVEASTVKSRKALEKWQRYLWKNDETLQSGGHIVKQFSYDTLSQAVLCEAAIEKLKTICDMEINFEADINHLPDNVRIGDRVNIIDDGGNLYVSTRILTLETSVVDNIKKAVLGEFLIKNSGISQKVADLAAEFAIKAAETAKAWQAAQEAQSTANQAREEASDAGNAAIQAKDQAEVAQSEALRAVLTASEAQEKADQAKAEVENMEIGGRNLLLGTGTSNGWSGQTAFTPTDREFRKSNATTSENYFYCNNLFDLEEGQIYTLSFKAKQNGYLKDGGHDIYILPKTWTSTGIAYNPRIENLTTEYQDYVFTFTPNVKASSLKSCQLRFDNEGSADGTEAILYVKDIKLEKGNKATDWTPAPEDVDTDIAEAAKTASNYIYHNTTDGLEVGDHSSGSWAGFRAQIKSTAFNILNAAGEVCASYGAKLIELGKNATDAIISLCGGKGTIKYNPTITEAEGDITYDGVLELNSEKVWLRGDESASLYSTSYTPPDESGISSARKSAVNVYPNHIEMYASSCGALNEDLVGHWESSELSVDPLGIYGLANHLNLMGRYDATISTVSGDIDINAGFGGDNVNINGMPFGVNNVLWSGGYYMQESHNISFILDQKISEQPNGIVLVFSRYYNGAVQDYHFNSFFVPKYMVNQHGGCGHCFFIVNQKLTVIACKYLYINDTSISGDDSNTAAETEGTDGSALTYNNKGFVLRYVIGV